MKGEKSDNLSIDANIGLLSVPISCSADQLVDWIQSEGDKVGTTQLFINELRERETQLRYLMLPTLPSWLMKWPTSTFLTFKLIEKHYFCKKKKKKKQNSGEETPEAA